MNDGGNAQFCKRELQVTSLCSQAPHPQLTRCCFPPPSLPTFAAHYVLHPPPLLPSPQPLPSPCLRVPRAPVFFVLLVSVSIPPHTHLPFIPSTTKCSGEKQGYRVLRGVQDSSPAAGGHPAALHLEGEKKEGRGRRIAPPPFGTAVEVRLYSN